MRKLLDGCGADSLLLTVKATVLGSIPICRNKLLSFTQATKQGSVTPHNPICSVTSQNCAKSGKRIVLINNFLWKKTNPKKKNKANEHTNHLIVSDHRRLRPCITTKLHVRCWFLRWS